MPEGNKPLPEPMLTLIFVASLNYTDEHKPLTHWGRVTHICVSKLTIMGSDNGLSPGRRQSIIWTNAGILLIEPLRTNLGEILIKIHIFSFKKMHLKTSGKWWPFCLCLNVLKVMYVYPTYLPRHMYEAEVIKGAINSWGLGRCDCNFKYVIFKFQSGTDL